MISHDRAQELISARMDAPLTPAEHRELQRHLAACDSCRDFVGQADDLARGLQVLPRLSPVPSWPRSGLTLLAGVGCGEACRCCRLPAWPLPPVWRSWWRWPAHS